MGEADWTKELSDVLFWDVDRKTVNPEKHLRWILERVLERGDYGDWLVLKKHVPAERMRGELKRLRIGPKADNFIKRYVNAVTAISR